MNKNINGMKDKNLSVNDIEKILKTLTHEEISEFRNDLKKSGNPYYLLRSLYYDYTQQVWIAPNDL